MVVIGSLSKGVFERRTATGNETFSLFTRLGATAFVILSVVTRVETIYLKIKAHPLLKNEKRPLPVAVRRPKTPLLKLPNFVLRHTRSVGVRHFRATRSYNMMASKQNRNTKTILNFTAEERS